MGEEPDNPTRLKAFQILLEHGYGKPINKVETVTTIKTSESIVEAAESTPSFAKALNHMSLKIAQAQDAEVIDTVPADVLETAETKLKEHAVHPITQEPLENEIPILPTSNNPVTNFLGPKDNPENPTPGLGSLDE